MPEPGILLVTPFPYVRELHRFTWHDELGARVAHDDLFLAALKYTDCDVGYIDTELDGPASLSSMIPAINETNTDDLVREFGPDRVRVSRLRNLEELWTTHQPVYVSGGPEMTNAASLRVTLTTPTCLPIANILHASYWGGIVNSYIGMVLSASPSDVFIATSRAGEQVVRRMLDSASEHISRSLGRTAFSDPQKHLRVVRLPLGVHLDSLQKLPKVHAREVLALPKDALVVLFVGRISEEYKADLEPLLLTVARLRSKYPKLLLLVAGHDKSGNQVKALRQIGTQIGLGNSLKIVTNFPRFLKSTLYSSADVFVSPAENIQETFGLSLLEAMSFSLPVIASDWSGYRDIVLHGQSGFLVPTSWNPQLSARINRTLSFLYANAVEHFFAQRTIVDADALQLALDTLLADSNLRTSMGAAGYQRVSRVYEWSVVAPQYEVVWKEQAALAARTRSENTSSETIDFNRIYGSMATRLLSEGLIIRCDVSRCKEAWLRSSRRFGSPKLRAETHRLIELLDKGPQTLGALQGSNTQSRSVTSDAISWLLKRGVCTFDAEDN